MMKSLGFRVVFVAIEGRGQDIYVRALRQEGIETLLTDGPAIGMPNAGSIPWAELCEREQFDIVWLTFWDVAYYYLPRLRDLLPKAIMVVDSVDLEFVRKELESAVVGQTTPQEVIHRRVLELSVYQAADVVIVVSKSDERRLRMEGIDKPIFIISNIHEVKELEEFYPYSEEIIFVGNFNHLPNRDGITWFVNSIFVPVVSGAWAGGLHVVGNAPTPDILALDGNERVYVYGWVEDINLLYRSMFAALAPLRYGAGVKGKITEALSVGVPVIATNEALVGMEELVEADAVLVADVLRPGSWLEALWRLNDRAEWSSIRRRAWEIGAELFSHQRALGILRQILAFSR